MRDLPKAPYLQQWNRDETLYSWAATYHAISGAMSAKESGRVMFGRPQACRQHELPNGLGHFVTWSAGQLGSITEIAEKRTILHEWRPFTDPPRWLRIVDQIASASSSYARTSSGITASGVGFRRHLRFCPACGEAHRAESGGAGWRMPHQLCWSFVCLDHEELLLEIQNSGNSWTLPPPENAQGHAVARGHYAAAERLAHIGAVFSAWPDYVPVHAQSRALTQTLAEGGTIHSVARLDGDRLSGWFRATPTSRLLESAYSQSPWLASGEWIVHLLRGRRTGHPLLWTSLWAEALRGLSVRDAVAGLQGALKSGQGAMIVQWDLWPELEPDVGFVRRLREHVITGGTLQDIATALLVPQHAVRRWLTRLPDLKQLHAEARRSRRGEEIIALFEEALEEQPSRTKTDLHRILNSEFAWLRTNNPRLLRDLLQRTHSPRDRQRDLWAVRASAVPRGG